jgi:predicted MPP superfamily phosphohydrolase
MKSTIGRLTLAAAVVLLLYSFAEPYWLTVHEVTIADPDLPPAFDGVLIAFLTDIHHGPNFSLARVRRVVQQTNALHPDLILLGGDYVFQDAQYIRPCFQELSALRAPLGLFGVLGNHDHWQDAVLTSQSMIDAGITWINNRAEWVEWNGQRIKIGGVGDLWEGSQNLGPTIDDASAQDFVILISHNPDYAESLATDKVDLMLSGHTHGGQLTLFGRWAPVLPSAYGQKYRSGVVTTRQTVVVVSKGIGTITPPVRLFCRPEIVLVRLSRED